MGGVRAVVSHLSLGGPARSSRLADNTESRCLSLIVSPRGLSLVKSVRPNEKPLDLLVEGLGSVTRRASADCKVISRQLQVTCIHRMRRIRYLRLRLRASSQ